MNKKIGVYLCLSVVLLSVVRAAEKPMNVLMIAVDDLNDWVGFLGGHPQAKTPNMDRLAAQGMVFENAQCAASVCNPSRAATMSGIAPYVSGVYGNGDFMRDSAVLKNAVTLPRYFSNHGYTSMVRGKIFHHPSGDWADPQSWDIFSDPRTDKRPVPIGQTTDMSPYKDMKVSNQLAVGGGVPIGWKGTMEPKETTADYQNALWAAQWLTDSAKQETPQPFFLACGIFRPHLPWNVPLEYYARFELDKTRLPPIKDDDLADIPGQSPSKEYTYALENGLREEAAWAYLANCAYADDCVGVILDALEKSPYRDNTIVVLWGDHGWHLGEKQRYKKFTLWEESARMPFLIKVPGMTPGRTVCPVGLIDLYPTLVELCGLPEKDGLSGRSIVPVLENPVAEWAHPAITTMGAGNHSLRTERWRYIVRQGGPEELYDHNNDPQEWTNLANNPEFAEVKARLKTFVPKAVAKEVEREEYVHPGIHHNKGKKGRLVPEFSQEVTEYTFTFKGDNVRWNYEGEARSVKINGQETRERSIRNPGTVTIEVIDKGGVKTTYTIKQSK
ncbi:Choline-sulfatase [Pontiella desulfatans]|uniref:Choline-sulfatase n=1 Tax=Pontiella desulfatans TaxID=2750659 RepID=A0A6C2U0C7_PONDE|nr:sulfatase [Pontiella desulfatans]SPS73785.1 sulfatase S1_7 [Kiritimatiellales bacterium]VGO13325.1 Choline-sulfatase [Pontiella desulfatans]